MLGKRKIFFVTKATFVNKRTVKSKVVGFVSTFGWESAEAKAKAKYPGLSNFQLHEK